MTRSIEIVTDSQQLARRAAELWCSWANSPDVAHRNFHVALSGGNTPKRLYQQLTQAPFRQQMPWQRVRLYFGDERYVPGDHPDSNFLMVKKSLLDETQFNQIFPIPTSVASPEEAASQYADTLTTNLPSVGGRGQFDLVLLGMGNDGHTASLFPGSKGLHEKHRDVIANFVEHLNAWRVTLTYPMINHAKRILILVEGESKAEIVKEVLDETKLRYPIQYVRAENETIWLLDQAAARLLDK